MLFSKLNNCLICIWGINFVKHESGCKLLANYQIYLRHAKINVLRATNTSKKVMTNQMILGIDNY